MSKTIGEMTPGEQRQAIARAAAAFQQELAAIAPQIGLILDSDADAAYNHSVTFMPSSTHPAMQIAGVLVFAYISEGVLRVSVDLDESEILAGPEQLTPMRITVQGEAVFEADEYGPLSLPLAERAPEVAELAAQLPAGEWGSDELGTLANWLACHGIQPGPKSLTPDA